MEDCNFFSIDWSRMAVGNYSYVATYYIPLAGNLTGQFINFLVDNGADLDLIHLIGHRYNNLSQFISSSFYMAFQASVHTSAALLVRLLLQGEWLE